MITKNNSFANYLFDIASEKKRVSDYLKYAKTLITILNNTEEIISAMSNKAIEKKQRKMMTFEIFDKILPPDFIYLL
jgi:F0F1-type ATP synthase delta subunit